MESSPRGTLSTLLGQKITDKVGFQRGHLAEVSGRAFEKEAMNRIRTSHRLELSKRLQCLNFRCFLFGHDEDEEFKG